MKLTRRTALGLFGASAATAILPGAGARAEGKVHEVQMLNKHPDSNERMVFHPDIVQAQPGDTIRFVAADPAHNSVTYDDMLPEGAEGWKTRMSQDAEVVVEAEGAYGYYCQPHKPLGMVGLILVGDAATNYEELKAAKLRGREQQRWQDIFARADKIVGA
ncbi:pseudoazurin [Roseovarius salis]|uniref:pseudoazurin n=1 Tax=Roseovarius salis TaxID=3376063 RepID=UPI0037CA8DD1